MDVGFDFRDAAGVLGPGSTNRLGRVMFDGTLAAGQSITLPWLNMPWTNLYSISPGDLSASNGAIYFTSFPYRLFVPVADGAALSWNNSTKVLTAVGAPRSIVVLGFRGAPPPVGGVGLIIQNANQEIIVDGVNPNLELVAAGSISTAGIWDVKSLPEVAAFPGSFPFLRWPFGMALIRGGGRQFALDGVGTLDYRIFRINPVYACISGGPPNICLTRGSDGLVVFDGKRSYARIRTLIQYENYSFFEGGTNFESSFGHNPIPENEFFFVGQGYSWGTRIHYIRRATTGLWASFIFDRNNAGLNGSWQNSLGLLNVGAYPGAYLPVTMTQPA